MAPRRPLPEADVDLPANHPFRTEAARDRYLDAYRRRAAHWPVPARDRYVQTAYGRTYVRECGPEGAAPLVLLPGIGASSLMWTGMAGMLARSHRVLAVDVVDDHGLSACTVSPRDGAGYARWIEDLLDGLRLREGVGMVGASYGGWMAMEHALRHPERLRRLALVAPVGVVARLSPGFAWRGLLGQLPWRACFRPLMRWMAGGLARGNEEQRALFEEMVDDGYTATRCFRPRRPAYPRVMCDREWATLAVPTLFLAGLEDRCVPVAKAIARLRRVAPTVRIETLAGAGHDLFATHPEESCRVLLGFLDEGA